jgi:Protein of unknown function (DUF2934)
MKKCCIKGLGTFGIFWSNCQRKEINRIAYYKWEEAGCPISDGVKFWLEAEKEYRKKSILIEDWSNSKCCNKIGVPTVELQKTKEDPLGKKISDCTSGYIEKIRELVKKVMKK